MITRRAYSADAVVASISREPGTVEARASSRSGRRTWSTSRPDHPATYRRAAGAAAAHASGTIGHATDSDVTPEWNTTVIPSTVLGKCRARCSRVRSSECRTRSTSSAWVDSCRARKDGDADSTHAT